MDYLSAQLAQMEDAELVRRAPDEDSTYLFNHVLTVETAYESLLVKRRKEIHRSVASAFEQLYPDRLDENAPLLAQHYAQAGDDEKTVVYAVRAGDAAARIFAYAEAGTHYALALDGLAHLPDTEERRCQRVDVLLRQVSVSLRAVGPLKTLKRLAVAENLARPFATRTAATREDRLRLGRVHHWQGQALIHQNETRAAIQHLRQALQVAQAENDPQLLAKPASVIGQTLVAQGQFAQAIPILTDAIRALEQTHDDQEWILAVGFRGVALTMQGDCAAGIAEAERSLAHATATNTLTGIALAHGALGLVHFFGDALAEGVAHARTMIEIADQSGDRLYAYLAFGFIAWDEVRRGNCRGAENDFAHANAIAKDIGARLLFADWFAAARAEYALRCGRVERALTLAGTVSQRARRNGCVFAEGIAERIRGQALAGLSTPRLDGAQVHLAKSLAKLEEGSAYLEAARTRVTWSQVLARSGDAPGAREQLEQAAAQFLKSGLIKELEQTKLLIDSLPAHVNLH
jgi:tetratricopeptide (TPR) repeat protein